jgi:hypothetical protein
VPRGRRLIARSSVIRRVVIASRSISAAISSSRSPCTSTRLTPATASRRRLSSRASSRSRRSASSHRWPGAHTATVTTLTSSKVLVWMSGSRTPAGSSGRIAAIRSRRSCQCASMSAPFSRRSVTTETLAREVDWIQRRSPIAATASSILRVTRLSTRSAPAPGKMVTTKP